MVQIVYKLVGVADHLRYMRSRPNSDAVFGPPDAGFLVDFEDCKWSMKLTHLV